ncbi:uncharacterized protein LOC131160924 [Malania oleifera]|uniref:uncharacterized protein LOC131160924 n=1 Tax=Malania oleifera TaxID=397392 RepID=UPI0025AE413D|nr:uncharacterized protein LOC131160924 [Malania oleifera]
MDLERLDIELVDGDPQGFIFLFDAELMKIVEKVRSELQTVFNVSEDEVLRFHTKPCVPNDTEIKRMILEEAYLSLYTIHPGSMKMYRDLRESFWDSYVVVRGSSSEGATHEGGSDSIVVPQLFMAEVMWSSWRQDRPTAELGDFIEKFTCLKPPTFTGSTNLILVENWIREIEKILVVLRCTDEQKVLYATFKLT